MPPTPQDDLLVRLINHRVSDAHARREDYATECLAWLLQRDARLLDVVVRGGGLFFPEDGGYRGDLAALVISTQDIQAPFDLRSRPDLVIRGPSFMLAIEAKVDSAFDREQVLRYSRRAGKLQQGFVASLVPAASRPDREPVHERLLRVAAWEEVVKLLDGLPGDDEATREYRAWMLRLLESYGLRPLEGPLDWHDATHHQDVTGVRRVCGIFDSVTKQVQADRAVAEVLPAAYLPDGALRLQTYTLIAGKGEAPRPVLSHSTILKSVLGSRTDFDFADVSLTVEFRTRAGSSASTTPSVWLDLRRQRLLGSAFHADFGEFAAELLVQRGIATVTAQSHPRLVQVGEGLWRRHGEDLLRLLDSVATELEGGIIPVDMSVAPQIDHISARLLLAPTTALCPSGADAETVQDRYDAWLRACISACGACGVEVPLNALLAGAALGLPG